MLCGGGAATAYPLPWKPCSRVFSGYYEVDSGRVLFLGFPPAHGGFGAIFRASIISTSGPSFLMLGDLNIPTWFWRGVGTAYVCQDEIGVTHRPHDAGSWGLLGP